MITTTLKGLVAHRGRLLTTAVAVILGVAFMAGTLVLTDTIRDRFDGIVADANAGTDTVVRAEAGFTAQSTLNGNGREVRDLLDASLVDTVAATDGVAAAAGRTSGFAQIVGSDGEVVGGGMEGLRGQGGNWVADERLNPFRLVDGNPPTAAGQVVIDSVTAEQGALSVGDRTTVLAQSGPTPVQVVGIADFGDAPGMYDTSSILFTDTAAQQLVGAPGRVGEVVAVAADGVGQRELTDRIAAVLPPGTEALPGAEVVAEEQAAVADDLGFFTTFLLVFAIVALFVGAFIIANTFSIIVAQRTRELAVLRAVGASRRQVLGSVLLESAVVGVVASLLGVVAGIGVAMGLQGTMSALGLDLPEGPLTVSASSLALAAGVGVVITIASSVLPARRAARIAPIAALRDTAVDTSAGSPRRIAAGVVTTLAGAAAIGAGLAGLGGSPLALVGLGAVAVFLGVAVLGPVLARPAARVLGAPFARLGLSGELARQNAMRSPKRTAATASALMVGVALVVFISMLAASIKASIDDSVAGTIRGELIVESGTFGEGGFDPALAAQIDELDEVAAASGLAFTDARTDGQAAVVGVMATAALEQLLAVDTETGSVAGLGEGRIAVQHDVATERGWTVGDTVEVVLADGATRPLEVAATYANRDLVDVLADRTLVEGIAPVPMDTSVFVRLADGVDLATGRAAVETVTDPVANAALQDRGEYVAAQAALVDPLLGLVYALLALAVVIAVLGIANTLSLSVMERVRELGLLRAVGMTRAQTRAMVRRESVLIALFGTGLGLVVGIGFAWALTGALESEGVTRVAVPVVTLAVVAVLAAFAGVAASLRPARRAAGVDLLAALRAS